MTFNPVVGCKDHCSYCYAKKMNDRFKFIKNWNIPEWKEKSFCKKLPKKPQRIFVGSMSEIAHWETLWVLKVLNKIEQHPEHIFQLLTKCPDVYLNYKFPDNCHLGVTITRIPKSLNNERMSIIEFLYDTHLDNLKFISFEPLLESINFKHLDLRNIGWVIIGFQTNPFKKIEKKSIEDIIEFTRKNKIPLFLKNSIYEGYPDLPTIKEFPTSIKTIKGDN